MTAWELISSVGISAVTAGTVVWGGAKVVAGKWLDTRFANRLEAVKLEGQKQLEANRQEHASYIEAMKFERAGLLDRSAKLNQREFEIIPDIWKNATEAHYALLQVISVWQQSPDVGRMTDPQFEACLAESRLEDWQKSEIRELDSYKRNTYYADALEFFRLQDANIALVGFNRAAANGSIFLNPETHAKFEGFGNAMRKTFRRWTLNRQFRLDGDKVGRDANDPIEAYRENGDTEYQELGRYLRERYWITPQGQAV